MAKLPAKTKAAVAISAEVKAILEAYAKAYNGEVPTLTIPAIQEIVDTYEGDAEALADHIRVTEGKIETDEGDESPDDVSSEARVTMSAQDVDKLALATANKLNADKAFMAFMSEGVQIDERQRQIVADMCLRLQADFSKDELNAMPEPGSKYDPESNQLTDRQKPGTPSWYQQVFISTDFGSKAAAEYDAIMEVKAGRQAPKGYEHFNKYNAPTITAEFKMYHQRIVNGTKKLRQAVSVLRHMARCEEMLTVKCSFRTTKQQDGSVVLQRTTAPIAVADLGNEKDWKAFGISAFLRVDPAKVKAKGGDNWTNFAAPSGTRGPSKNKQAVEGFKVTPKLVVPALTQVGEGLLTDDDGTIYANITDQLEAPDSDDTVWAMHVLSVALSKAMQRPKVKAIVDRLREANAKAAA